MKLSLTHVRTSRLVIYLIATIVAVVLPAIVPTLP